MTILCLGALAAGLVAASLIPFLPFACAVMAAILIGSTSMILGGAQIGPTCLSALALLSTSQIGYGLGLVAVALVTQGVAIGRRAAGKRQVPPPAGPLRTGNEPH